MLRLFLSALMTAFIRLNGSLLSRRSYMRSHKGMDWLLPWGDAKAKDDPCAQYARVAIFDIDSTLTVGADHDERVCPVLPGPRPSWPARSGTTQDVKNAIATAHSSGYKLAVASAESYSQQYNAEQRAFLKELFGDFGILGTPAEQSSYNLLAQTRANRDVTFSASDGGLGARGMKQAMILNIMQHYGVPPMCFHNSVLIDDEMENNATAHFLGLKTVQASPECGGVYCSRGCGITPNTASVLRSLSLSP